MPASAAVEPRVPAATLQGCWPERRRGCLRCRVPELAQQRGSKPKGMPEMWAHQERGRGRTIRRASIQGLHLNLVVRLQIEFEFIEFKDPDAVYGLFVAELLNEGNCLLNRLELVVPRMSIGILKYDHVLRPSPPSCC